MVESRENMQPGRTNKRRPGLPATRAPTSACAFPGHGCADLSAAPLFAVLPFLVVERRSLGVRAWGIAQAAPGPCGAAPVLESREEMRCAVDR